MNRTGQATQHFTSALSLALIGALSLFAALTAHDVLSFGARGHDLIAPWGTTCSDWPCSTMNLMIFGQIAKGIGSALVFALIGAIWVSARGRLGIGGAFWLAQFLWSLIGIASGYRTHFGTNWRWWEPFAEVMWAPGLTLPLLLCGMATFLVMARWTTPGP